LPVPFKAVSPRRCSMYPTAGCTATGSSDDKKK
jgi:hypothetical protein